MPIRLPVIRLVHALAALLLILFAVKAHAQTAASLSPTPMLQFFDASSGIALPCVGCTLSTFAAGTNTPLKTYVDSTGTTQNPLVITLNAQGYSTSGIWIGSACYKYVLANAAGSTIWTQDKICSSAGGVQYLFPAAVGSAGQALVSNGTNAIWSTTFRGSSSGTTFTVGSGGEESSFVNTPGGVTDTSANVLKIQGLASLYPSSIRYVAYNNFEQMAIGYANANSDNFWAAKNFQENSFIDPTAATTSKAVRWHMVNTGTYPAAGAGIWSFDVLRTAEDGQFALLDEKFSSGGAYGSVPAAYQHDGGGHNMFGGTNTYVPDQSPLAQRVQVLNGVTGDDTIRDFIVKAFDTNGSAQALLDRKSTLGSATINLLTNGTIEWFIGMRGLSDQNFYITNNTGGFPNELIINQTTHLFSVNGAIEPGGGYLSTDGSTGVTGGSCSAWKNGLCVTL